MSKVMKALARLQTRPHDFTWSELQTIMKHFGYQEKKGVDQGENLCIHELMQLSACMSHTQAPKLNLTQLI
jgi:hypothetical protein